MEIARITRAQMIAMLTPWIADPLTGAALELYVNDITPNANSVLGDFTLASFPDYAAGTVSVPGAPDIVGGNIQLALGQGFFQTDNDVVAPEIAYGFIIVDGTDLLAYGRFEEPVTFATAGDFAAFTPVIEIPLS